MPDTKDILPLKVSFFQHKGVRRATSIALTDALHSFCNGTYGSQISHLHKLVAEGNMDEYSIQKGKLPAITFCGEFSGGHSKSNMTKYNYLLIVDIDKLSEEEYSRAKDCLLNDEYVFAYWTSPSGNGIKGLICLKYSVDIFFDDISDYHTYAFRQVKKYFEGTHNIDLDKSGSDTSRLCFVTSDNNIVVKKEFKQFEIDLSGYSTPLVVAPPTLKKTASNKKIAIPAELLFHKQFLNPEGKNRQSDKQEMLSVIKFLRKKKKSITYCYDNWYRTAFAIANSFSCDLGEKYFLELCRLDGAMHDEAASKKILIYSYENSRGSINFPTIIHFAKEQGYVKSKRDSIEDG